MIFEALVSNLSAHFINLPSDEVDAEIVRALASVREHFSVDTCALFKTWEDKQGFLAEYVSSAPGILLPERIEISRAKLPFAAAKLLVEHEVSIVERLSDLPEEAAVDAETRMALGIKSALAIPIILHGDCEYVITMQTLTTERTWPLESIPRLRVLGEVLVNALERKQKDLDLMARYREIEDLKQKLEHENLYLRTETKLLHEKTPIIGQSDVLKRTIALAHQVAQTESIVLIQGETGTGKELIAHAIHLLSRHKDRLMVKVNCAALPGALIENELFGREKGAYTGALSKQIGRFELADGSTIFLDEIAELPLKLQAKLLRVLESGEFERLGSPKTLRVNVRLIAATNRDLAELVEKGRFREDLFYRLNVFPIRVPPLRERTEDVPILVQSFIAEFASRMGKRVRTVSPKTLEEMKRYSWPGNIRELRNIIEQAVIISDGELLEAVIPQGRPAAPSGNITLGEAEYKHILSALQKCEWRIKGPRGAAQQLGLKPSTLYAKMERLGISSPRGKSRIVQ